MTLTPGSIHALLGENGAGKSTLIKIITGVHHRRQRRAADRTARRSTLADSAPGDARPASRVVHQERNLIPRFSIGENIMLERLGAERAQPGRLPRRARRGAEVARHARSRPRPAHARRAACRVAQMQLVEIAKALSLRSRVLLLDEPTASLTPHETDALFARAAPAARRRRRHRLRQPQARGGARDLRPRHRAARRPQRLRQPAARRASTAQDLVQLMIGRSERIPDLAASAHRADGAPALELRGVATADGHRDVNLTVRAGEIVGLYGLVGAGRSELAKAILGRDPRDRRRDPGRRASPRGSATSRDRARPLPASAMSARTARARG